MQLLHNWRLGKTSANEVALLPIGNISPSHVTQQRFHLIGSARYALLPIGNISETPVPDGGDSLSLEIIGSSAVGPPYGVDGVSSMAAIWVESESQSRMCVVVQSRGLCGVYG